jgi:hypothetical protein
MTSRLPVARVGRHLTRALLVLVSLSAVPRSSSGQSDEERAAARQTALEGIKALKEQRYPAAIDLLSRAESVMHAPTHLLYLARAQMGLGQLVRARENYLKIVKENIDPSKPKAFHDAKAEAEKELAALEPRIPVITAVVDGAQGKSVTVTMDGTKMSAALVGLARPVDPGEHRFQASADGMASDLVTVKVKEGGNERVTLTLKPGAAVVSTGASAGPEATGTPASPAGTSAAPTPENSPPPPPGAEEPGGGVSGLRTAGFVVTGVGVVGLGVGTAFILMGKSQRDEANSICPPDKPCPIGTDQNHLSSLDSESTSKMTIGGVSLAVGGVSLAAGVTMIILGKPKSATQSEHLLHLTPFAGLRELGVAGTF